MKDYFSKDFKNLLYGLLEKNSRKRLTLQRAKEHAFFKKINWENFEKKVGLKPPIKPNNGKKNMSVKQQDKDTLISESMPSPILDRKSNMEEANKKYRKGHTLFKGFTYIEGKDNKNKET